MDIRVHTNDRRLTFDLLGKSRATVGDAIELDQGVLLTYEGTYIRKALDFPEIIMLSASIPTSVAAGVLANWLWEKLKGRNVAQIEIDRTTVEFEEGEIKRIVREKITERKSKPEGGTNESR